MVGHKLFFDFENSKHFLILYSLFKGLYINDLPLILTKTFISFAFLQILVFASSFKANSLFNLIN